MRDGKGCSNKEQFSQYGDEDVFIFDEDDFDAPIFVRDKISGALEISDFTWNCKDGLPYRISIEPPYQIHVEQIASIEGENSPTPCKVLTFAKNK